MKPDIHPEYRQVVFHDTSCDAYFVVGSTLKTDQTIEYQGKTYPYYNLDVSSQSHPYYTGEQRTTKNQGRVAKFKNKFKGTFG
ncbi:type B 50S ribosomal protein L31 [Shewanella sp. WXL01]|uniref:Large ribosomal subunit protein bL31B n=1 Tax=Shewanella maritima TaxID=2520507 RepID=A0A411PD89_9GAMM|nr:MULTISPECIES: type B 50S ribosomal protein L31 [Shewanella]NKF50485.1 type B 50S ribosomal protein L31 [Shewanella sp. WXL01]QBF81513.1 type B 50S ribosomal protein L31 [Shewanella maritima]